MDVVEGFIIAVDDKGDQWLLETPEWIHPSFFEEGSNLNKLSIRGFREDKPGVYNVELMFSVVKNYLGSAKLGWGNEVEWFATGWMDHTKEVVRG